jgi:hypothetical protein
MLDQARRASQHPVMVAEGTEHGAAGGPTLPQPIIPGSDGGRGAMMWKTR